MPKKQMLINYVPGEECRIAIEENGRLEELYQERASSESHVGNIYKGRVSNVEPSIQAAFIDFGLERNGFLHITDVHPMYFPGDLREEFERVGNKTPRRERPPIQKCLKRGDKVLVQVIKEGIGSKGPTLTSYLSIPGRFIVMMPHMKRLGVSRKIEDEEIRRKLRKSLDELDPPKDLGFIIRTAGLDRNKTELKRDLSYLLRLWKSIDTRQKKVVVGELFAESDLIVRTIRDVYSNDIDRVIADHPEAAKRAQNFLSVASPRAGAKVVVYNDPVPLFHRFTIEEQIETIHARTVELKSGAYLVIDSTEAMVAIDVNSGKNRQARDAETNAFKINKEAADEISRQLRLRDLGGVVVIDFIDMTFAKHRRAIEQQFRNNLKQDRARTRVGSISQFGLMELTRQRMRPSLRKSIYMDCPACNGAAVVRRPESVVLDVMRRMAMVSHQKNVAQVVLTVSPNVAFRLLNHRRGQLVALETQYGNSIEVRVNDGGSVDFVQIDAFDGKGVQIDAEQGGTLDEPVFEAVEAMQEIDEEHFAEAGEEAAAELAEQHMAVERFDSQAAQEAARRDVEFEEAPAVDGEDSSSGDEGKKESEDADGGAPKKKRRRRRGGRKSKAARERVNAAEEPARAEGETSIDKPEDDSSEAGDDKPDEAEDRDIENPIAAKEGDAEDDDGEKKTKGRRRRRGRRGGKGRSRGKGGNNDAENAEKSETKPSDGDQGKNDKPAPQPVGSGYANRVLTPSEREAKA